MKSFKTQHYQYYTMDYSLNLITRKPHLIIRNIDRWEEISMGISYNSVYLSNPSNFIMRKSISPTLMHKQVNGSSIENSNRVEPGYIRLT